MTNNDSKNLKKSKIGKVVAGAGGRLYYEKTISLVERESTFLLGMIAWKTRKIPSRQAREDE